MKCFVCGAEIENGQICPNCGCDNSKSTETNVNNYPMQGGNMTGYTDNAQISPISYQQYPMNNPYNKPPKQKKPINKKMVAIIAGIVLIAIVAVVAIIILSNRPKTVELNKYVTIEVQDGYDGYGKVTYEIDTDKFKKDYPDIEYSDDFLKQIEKEYGRDTESFMIAFPAKDMLAQSLSGEFDKDTRLSNGDVVHFSWSLNKKQIEKDFNVKLKFSDIEYTVDGLKKAETFDPFANIDVKFSGIEPYGEADYEIVKNDGINDDLTFRFDKDSDLKNGDTVKLSILSNMSVDELYDYCIDHFGKIPESYEKSYTVELDRYVESASEIDQDTMDAMDKQARDILEAFVVSEWAEPDLYKGMTLIGNYFLKCKFDEEINNKIYLIYRVEVSTKEYWEDTVEYYYYTEYEDLVKDKNGKTQVDLSNYKTPIYGYSDESFILGGYTRNGYKELKSIFDTFIASSIEKYEYEDNVKDLDNGKLMSESTPVSSLIGKEVEFNGHRYMLVYASGIYWGDAKTLCENEGGHLVTITSKEEQAFIARLCGYEDKRAWIGWYKSWNKDTNQKEPHWVTGEKIEYTFFGSNGDSAEAGYVEGPNYLWSSSHMDIGKWEYYICEWDE